MKYETPELVSLTPAINAIQTIGSNKTRKVNVFDSPDSTLNDGHLAYADWE